MSTQNEAPTMVIDWARRLDQHVIQQTIPPPKKSYTPQRTGSTKTLILRFEGQSTTSNTPSSHSTPIRTRSAVASDTGTSNRDAKSPSRIQRALTTATSVVPKSGEGTLPLRQSIRNFLSTITSRKVSAKHAAITEAGNRTPISSPDAPSTPPKYRLPELASAGVCHLPESDLYYLVCPPGWTEATPSIVDPLIWTRCTATLKSGSLMVSIALTGHSDPIQQDIELAFCTNVHSVLLADISEAARATLPDKDLKVFKLLFEGRRAEIFAVPSVTARARWVNIIWNEAILCSNNKEKSSTQSHTHPSELKSGTTSTYVGSKTESTMHSMPVPPKPISNVSSGTLLIDRVLPPLPLVETSAKHLQAPSSLDRKASLTNHHRPSVRDLGKRNVVSQRVAELRAQAEFPSPIKSIAEAHSERSTYLVPPTLPTVPSAQEDSDSYSFLNSYYSPKPSLLFEHPRPLTLSPTTSVSQGASLSAGSEENAILDAINTRTSERRAQHDELCAKVACLGEDILSVKQEVVAGFNHIISNVGKVPGNLVGNNHIRDPHTEVLESALVEVKRSVDETRNVARQDAETVLCNLAEVAAMVRDGRNNVADVDLTVKVDQILTAIGAQCRIEDGTMPYEVSQKLNLMLALLNETRTEHLAQVDQQTDNIRYLSELNTWMETFVNHSTVQNNALAAELQRLGASLTSEAVVEILKQQRQEQEHILRSLAADIRDNIKDERLRFVDAMKEATAINVHMHVEQLKQQFARETTAMINEVTRLQHERYALEQHIVGLRAQEQQMNALYTSVGYGHHPTGQLSMMTRR